jgi:hypothetical protein
MSYGSLMEPNSIGPRLWFQLLPGGHHQSFAVRGSFSIQLGVRKMNDRKQTVVLVDELRGPVQIFNANSIFRSVQ